MSLSAPTTWSVGSDVRVIVDEDTYYEGTVVKVLATGRVVAGPFGEEFVSVTDIRDLRWWN